MRFTIPTRVRGRDPQATHFWEKVLSSGNRFRLKYEDKGARTTKPRYLNSVTQANGLLVWGRKPEGCRGNSGDFPQLTLIPEKDPKVSIIWRAARRDEKVFLKK